MRSVVITGASSGIGHACVAAMQQRGFCVFAGVRRPQDGDRLQAEFGPHVCPLLFDVTDASAIEAAAAEVRASLGGETLAGLVNNAGVAVAGPLLHLPLDELRQQMEINVIGQLAVTQAFAPLLGADRSLRGEPGRIVMMSSVSGQSAAPFVGPYAASKFALEGMSESLRRELILYGIDVIVIAPGPVETPIWSKADEIDTAPYELTDYAAPLREVKAYIRDVARNGMSAERIGRLVADSLTRQRRKPRYAVNASPVEALAMRLLPRRWLDRIMARRLGLTKRPTA